MANPVPNAFLVDGLIVFRGPGPERIAAGYELEIPNLQQASHQELNQFQDVISSILRQLPDGWTLQVKAFQDQGNATRLLDYAAASEQGANPAARLLRNANFLSHWRNREQRLLRRKRVVLYVSRPVQQGLKVPWRRRAAEVHYAQLFADARLAFGQWWQTMQTSLHSMGGRVTPLSDAENTQLWAETLNPGFAERINYDAAQDFDPAFSLAENFWQSEIRGQPTGQGFLLDGWSHLVITLKRLPSETFPAILQRLTSLAFGDVTITTQLHRLPKEQISAEAQKSMDRIHQQLIRKPDERLAVTHENLQEKVRRLASGEVVPFELEFIIVLRAKSATELTTRAAIVKGVISGLNGAKYYEASLAVTARNLFCKTLPGWTGSRHQGFKHYVEDRVAADLLPLCSSFSGHPGPVEALFPGAENNLVNIASFLTNTPQHTGILGATGFGKSECLLKWLFETSHNFQFTGILEAGLAQARYTRSFGIEPIVVRLDGKQTLNPLDTHGLPMDAFIRVTMTALAMRFVGLPKDEDKARRWSALIARQLAQLCQDFAREHLRQWPDQRRGDVIRHALALEHWGRQAGLSQVAAFIDFREHQIKHPDEAAAFLNQFGAANLGEFESTASEKIHNLLFAYLRPGEHLTLSSLREALEFAEQDEEECRYLATLLSPFCRGVNHGDFLDGASTVSLNGPVVHFELGLVSKSAEQFAPIIGFLAINSMRQHVLSLPHPLRKRIVIEEISHFLDVPGGAEMLRELLEQFRKYNVQVIYTGQQFSRFGETPLRGSLIGNTSAWFIFNTGDAQDIERLGQALGLSRVACETIKKFPRPDQLTGPNRYSEFLYVHTAPRSPIVGPVRHVLLPHEVSASPLDVSLPPPNQQHS